MREVRFFNRPFVFITASNNFKGNEIEWAYPTLDIIQQSVSQEVLYVFISLLLFSYSMQGRYRWKGYARSMS